MYIEIIKEGLKNMLDKDQIDAIEQFEAEQQVLKKVKN